jgi:hypothetical protein
MSKRKLAYQFAGGVIGLISLNLAFTPSASAGGSPPNPATTNISNASGTNISNASGGYYQYYEPSCGSKCGYYEYVPFNGSNNSGYNASNSSGFYISYKTNLSNGSGVMFYPYETWNPPKVDASNPGGGQCKTSPCPPGTDPKKDPFENGSTTSGVDTRAGGSYVIGKNNFSQFDGGGRGGNNYGGSSAGLSRQMMALLTAASNAYAEASARLAAIQSQATPSAQKDTSVRYSRVADANADCGCNASAAAPDNSVELAAAKKAEVEAAESLAKAQKQAREFLEEQRKLGTNLANGTQFTPIW